VRVPQKDLGHEILASAAGGCVEGQDLPNVRPVSRTPRSAYPLRFPLRGFHRWPVVNAVVAACLVSSLARADIYKYVDRDGVIHFSNVSKKGQLVERHSETRPTPAPARPATPSASSEAARNPTNYDAYIREAARLYQIPEALVRAVIRVESNFDPRAVSRANAQGLMQLIPATAERMLVTDPFDARQNVLGGTRYLRVLANLFNGNIQFTLAAYNAGENAVIKYRGIPPFEETQMYVTKVMQFYNIYRGRQA
jgi:soluble lytic murein transglycosylase-like protein